MIVKKQKYSRTVENLRNAVLTLLVALLVLLTIIYIGRTNIYRTMTKTDEKKVFDKLWSTQSDVLAKGLDGERLLPEFIGYKLTGSSPQCSIADRESAIELYELITPCLLELLGSGSYCDRIDVNAGKTAIEAAISSGEYIYLRYHEPVLYQLIYAYASGKLTLSEDSAATVTDGFSGAYISEIVIIPDSELAAHRFIAYATDGQGHYYKFSRDGSMISSDFHISKLADSSSSISTLPFSFADVSLAPTQPLVSGELSGEELVQSKINTSIEETAYPLLTLFGYNTDKLRGFTDEDDGVGVYYTATSRMRLSLGSVVYTAAEGGKGLALDDLLGYSTVEGMSLYDKLTAVDNLLASIADISPSLVGGEAALCLGGVYTEGELLVIEYFPTYNNLRIGLEPSVRVTIWGDRLDSFRLDAVAYSTNGAQTLSPPQEYILRMLTTSMQLGIADIRMRYSYDQSLPEWQIILPTEEALRRGR